nr:hypothetical protein [Halorubrum saccharovorum]
MGPADSAAAEANGRVERGGGDAERDDREEGEGDREEGVPLHVRGYAVPRE